eukprot:1501469-Amphidinium_carterae.3
MAPNMKLYQRIQQQKSETIWIGKDTTTGQHITLTPEFGKLRSRTVQKSNRSTENYCSKLHPELMPEQPNKLIKTPSLYHIVQPGLNQHFDNGQEQLHKTGTTNRPPNQPTMEQPQPKSFWPNPKKTAPEAIMQPPSGLQQQPQPITALPELTTAPPRPKADNRST